MNDVMAVHGPITHKVPETEEERDVLAELQPCNILAGYLDVGNIGAEGADTGAASAKSAVAAAPLQDLELFQMDVDGVLPTAGRVAKDPVFRAVLRYGETQFITVCEATVDGPLTIVALKFEGPRDARRDDTWQLIEHLRRRVNTVVGDCGPNLKLHAGRALTAGEDIASWRPAVILRQPILQANLSMAAYQTLDLVEVNDDVIALRHSEAKAGDLQGPGEQVAVIRNHPEWNHRVRTERIGQEQFVEARRPAVQHPKAITPLIDT